MPMCVLAIYKSICMCVRVRSYVLVTHSHRPCMPWWSSGNIEWNFWDAFHSLNFNAAYQCVWAHESTLPYYLYRGIFRCCCWRRNVEMKQMKNTHWSSPLHSMCKNHSINAVLISNFIIHLFDRTNQSGKKPKRGANTSKITLSLAISWGIQFQWAYQM